jgi:hypothetical protein
VQLGAAALDGFETVADPMIQGFADPVIQGFAD